MKVLAHLSGQARIRDKQILRYIPLSRGNGFAHYRQCTANKHRQNIMAQNSRREKSEIKIIIAEEKKNWSDKLRLRKYNQLKIYENAFCVF